MMLTLTNHNYRNTPIDISSIKTDTWICCTCGREIGSAILILDSMTIFIPGTCLTKDACADKAVKFLCPRNYGGYYVSRA